MKLLSTLKHEAQEIGMVALYFFFCFGVLLTLKKLLLADYRIEVNALSTAAISALIAAKIVIVLDKTRAGNRFDARLPLVLAAFYKTWAYMLATLIVLFLEKLFHAYRDSGALAQAVLNVWTHKDVNIMVAKLICISLTFFAYHLYAGIDRRLGEGTLRRLVLTRPVAPQQTPNSNKG